MKFETKQYFKDNDTDVYFYKHTLYFMYCNNKYFGVAPCLASFAIQGFHSYGSPGCFELLHIFSTTVCTVSGISNLKNLRLIFFIFSNFNVRISNFNLGIFNFQDAKSKIKVRIFNLLLETKISQRALSRLRIDRMSYHDC